MMRKILLASTLTLLLSAVLTGCQAGKETSTAANDSSAKPSIDIPWIATKNTTRINSSDPIQAAVLVSQTLWSAQTKNNTPSSVVLTDLSNWQIAAASTDLIHHPSNGPVLYVTPDGIPEATLKELKRLNPLGAAGNNEVQVVLVGPMAANVEEQLKPLKLKVDKITGDEPAAIAQSIDAYYAKASGKLPQAVIIGSMDSPEFTLPAVNWIAHMPEPLLYVTKDEIPAPTIAALKERGGKATIYILGPKKIISAAVEQQLQQYGSVTRVYGNDAYENAISFAKFKDSSNGFGWGITTPGHNLSLLTTDSTMLAIAAAPFSHLGKHAPLIFTKKDGLSDAVMEYMMTLQPKFKDSPAEGPYNHAWLTGDSSSITAGTQSEIDDMLEISSASGENPHSGH
ncbi:cell wall-binding repeat-containing protein [Paenibacillus sp. 19GGS1-52]|uniref:cell wall-binding repeat-containing protein n=1 Tax=Paenibacillus sp. 19GGS1-52 TaxID=2758563 RepID=UPI001EFA5336|nr:cell wall-binding repeat-containing protein [Paenibacillus sp. 19GGS1-52]ULO05023.1 cell wall-binding repeat-containing protein [Paenibacillus sp. 19GGS1-52]